MRAPLGDCSEGARVGSVGTLKVGTSRVGPRVQAGDHTVVGECGAPLREGDLVHTDLQVGLELVGAALGKIGATGTGGGGSTVGVAVVGTSNVGTFSVGAEGVGDSVGEGVFSAQLHVGSSVGTRMLGALLGSLLGARVRAPLGGSSEGATLGT